MNIAVLSGKGGTGKTLISVNLAAISENSSYIDCDVEEPNGHLFFKPKITAKKNVNVKIPVVDNELCNGCRKCVEFCNYNALAYIKDRLLVFEEICHSCGGCVLVCPSKALTEKERPIGVIESGDFVRTKVDSGTVKVHTGIMNTGEASGVPIIKELLKEINSGDNSCSTFIDCPPGSACVVMESIQDADYCVLVAEPTIFGAHNLEMVYELVKLFKKPYGAILNKCFGGENPSEKFCKDKNIKILGRIPFDHDLGLLNSNAEIASLVDRRYGWVFKNILLNLKKDVEKREGLVE